MHKAIFTKDFDKATVVVTREFDAPVSKVWHAWTTVSELEKWWAPLPYKAVTKSFDFKVGGHWHYYMLSPEGEKHWCYVGYENIVPEKSFAAADGFCDENMVVDTTMPQMHWENTFENIDGRTKVTVTTTLASKEALETLVQMGFEEGFTMGLNQLETLLTQ